MPAASDALKACIHAAFGAFYVIWVIGCAVNKRSFSEMTFLVFIFYQSRQI
jgi:hypothetical protein